MKYLNALHRFSNSWIGTIVIVLFLIFFVVQSFVIPSGSMKRTLHEGDFLFAKKFAYGTPLPTLPWLEIPILPDFNGNGHLITGSKPQREDIVIFRFPEEHKVHYVKRCVATGGDELIYTNKHLYLHFSEGDAYIRQNYPAEKIKTLMGKLWVDNPYKDKYPGIQYQPSIHGDIFHHLVRTLQEYGHRKKVKTQTGQEAFIGIDMSPINLPELEDSRTELFKGQRFNAFYKKVEEDRFYMIGDNRDNSNDSRFWGSVSYSEIVGKPWVIYMSIDWDTYEIRWNRVGRIITDLQFEEPTY